VLNIWGSWCGPCRGEMDDLQQLHLSTQAGGVAMSASTCATTGPLPPTSCATARSPTVLFDFPAAPWTPLHGYPRNTVPSTIVLDREHRVAAVFHLGPDGQLAPVVAQLAAERVD